ncbi:hypothetical protein [Allomesorhizobium camelthorni]|uniref:Uncharacterized protein n=1 Tax=Allomesorhizobium camelthorni TaxID=475069 RepID=A0A6G4W6Q6_9HYPH|nr:hypothetical protein [Mesorhizobium camelthorni]NGO50422.1 hypothetical protein [Mesorhizobium camelthorni]
MIVDWPIHALPPGDVAIATDYLNRPDQEATNGMARTIGQSGARFRVSLIDLPVYDAATVRTLRALLGLAEGRTNLIRFRLPDLYGIDGPFSQATADLHAQYPDGVPFSTGVLFSTGVGFKVADLKGTIGVAAALNARELYLGEAAPQELGGSYVSIQDFCYTVTGSWSEDNRIKISPVLRRAITAGTLIQYAPRFVGRMVTDSPGYEALKQGMFGLHTVEFVEDLTRARLPYAPNG